MNFRLGCAVWAYKEWVGNLFPTGSSAKNFLRLYSDRFTTVEGNTTFYSIPDAETVHRWKTETPHSFRFCLKLPRTITHGGLLASAIPQTLTFLQQMEELGDRLGPFFAQLPPSYSPAQLEDLTTFLQDFPRTMPLALEVRHPAWFQAPYADQLNDRLTQFGIGRVLLDTRPIYDCPDDPQRYSERRKPHVPLQPAITAPFALIRYISHPDSNLNQPYLEAWAALVHQWLNQGTQIYFFVHCPVERYSPDNARQFQQLLDQNQVPVPPLPWNAIEQPEQPEQLSLF
jgi:uncharacterized protein YecE (DUF72 family)